MSENNDQQPRRHKTFSFDEVIHHIRVHHPGCPKTSRMTIAARVSAKDWGHFALGAAIGIEMQAYIRHALTDYHQLLRSNMMTRDEARAFIAPQIQQVLRSWRESKLRLRAVRPKSDPDTVGS